jgi:hypothetical protein
MVKYDTTESPAPLGEDHHLLPRFRLTAKGSWPVSSGRAAAFTMSRQMAKWNLINTTPLPRHPRQLVHLRRRHGVRSTPRRGTGSTRLPSHQRQRVRLESNGAGKYPAHYVDNLPGVCDIGRGSTVSSSAPGPFPAKYQKAMFICD